MAALQGGGGWAQAQGRRGVGEQLSRQLSVRLPAGKAGCSHRENIWVKDGLSPQGEQALTRRRRESSADVPSPPVPARRDPALGLASLPGSQDPACAPLSSSWPVRIRPWLEEAPWVCFPNCAGTWEVDASLRATLEAQWGGRVQRTCRLGSDGCGQNPGSDRVQSSHLWPNLSLYLQNGMRTRLWRKPHRPNLCSCLVQCLTHSRSSTNYSNSAPGSGLPLASLLLEGGSLPRERE